jgi:aryl sulfotransferase
MNEMSPGLPLKTREIHNHHMDSTMWNDFRFRDDDIVIATYAKSGTTWMQQIVSQLLFDGQEGLHVHDMSPWLDLRVPPRPVKLAGLEAQTHRRFIKTHLPVDALVFSPAAKYLYLARDGRDVVWSLYNHHANASDLWYQMLNDSPGRVGPPLERPTEDITEYFRQWLDGDGLPFWSFWENLNSWWAIRHLPNVMFVHYETLRADMPAGIRSIADFLEIPVDPAAWPAILDHCSFGYMKDHADEVAPRGGAMWEGGGKTFINKGVNGRWRDVLSKADSARYEAMAVERLGPECAAWLKSGGPV